MYWKASLIRQEKEAKQKVSFPPTTDELQEHLPSPRQFKKWSASRGLTHASQLTQSKESSKVTLNPTTGSLGHK